MEEKIKMKFSNYYHELIIVEIAELYNVEQSEIFLGSRKKNIIFAKRMYIFILRTMFGLSLQEIGDITNLHHSSIIHHTRKFDFFYNNYIKDSDSYQNIKTKIYEANLDEKIDALQKQSRVINLELTKLFNIKKKENDKKRKELYS